MSVLTTIIELKDHVGEEVTLHGWVSNKRSGKGIAFIILRDGSGFLQCVASQEELGEDNFNLAMNLTLESSVSLSGKVVEDERQIGGFELQVTKVEPHQIVEEYPIAKKEHGVDFLMEKRHLWLRSRKQWANMRVRNRTIFAIHEFFQKKGFVQMDAPLFTGNACEGTTDLFETDFYGDTAYLSQSGQLYGEAMAMAMGKIYTFGPTFRAEKSKTRRHLSEFWMIEPEMAYYTNEMNMDLIEEFIQHVIGTVVKDCRFELEEVLERDLSSLEKIPENHFPRIPYEDAVSMLKGEVEVNGKTSIQVLQEDLDAVIAKIDEVNAEIKEKESQINAGGLKKGKLNFFKNKVGMLKAELKDLEEQKQNIPQWMESAKNFKRGEDLGGSDETVLTRLFSLPVMVYNWPTEIKAFYMKLAEGDPAHVKGVDVLAPEGYGEIVGGGERETDIDRLVEQIKHHDLPMHEFEWYLDLRRYGSVPHSGFGLGLERMVAWITGTRHIRETIPFPRAYGRLFP